jgi:hypothetical protein
MTELTEKQLYAVLFSLLHACMGKSAGEGGKKRIEKKREKKVCRPRWR